MSRSQHQQTFSLICFFALPVVLMYVLIVLGYGMICLASKHTMFSLYLGTNRPIPIPKQPILSPSQRQKEEIRKLHHRWHINSQFWIILTIYFEIKLFWELQWGEWKEWSIQGVNCEHSSPPNKTNDHLRGEYTFHSHGWCSHQVTGTQAIESSGTNNLQMIKSRRMEIWLGWISPNVYRLWAIFGLLCSTLDQSFRYIRLTMISKQFR